MVRNPLFSNADKLFVFDNDHEYLDNHVFVDYVDYVFVVFNDNVNVFHFKFDDDQFVNNYCVEGAPCVSTLAQKGAFVVYT